LCIWAELKDGQGPLDGEVEADETYIGGRNPAKEGGKNKLEKTVVMGMLDRESGEVISKGSLDSTRPTLRGQIEAHLAKGSTIHTDEWAGYRQLHRRGYVHRTVNHAAKEYARDGSHVKHA
jgi:transposase